ncbi:uncharacterized protein LOC115438966 [Sphaeramia orbicularis]|uniref:uncharacterized protein LOC115438966 n=1 Tax=Sphaeramia orbicularis TaxID=375764 RepID=UPI00117BF185|nr:uncharacterized protein LOC115438966 [Sphaeramia orbicularis]
MVAKSGSVPQRTTIALEDSATLYFPCRATEGRFVGVFLPGTRRVLSLCEVEVYSVDDAFPTPNVALRGEAAQSSTLSFAAAFKAIDGRRNSFYTKGSCSHTAEGETSPWWRVDLLRTFIITSIKVTNRGDCCAERLDGAEIRIGKSLHNNGNDNPRCATISHIRPGKTLTIHCDNGMMEGRYVNMVIPGNGKTLTLCEVEVYATPKVAPLQNVALWKTTAQVSAYQEHHANGKVISGDSAKAVDGCRLLNFVQNCCVHTLEHNNPWWFVDLVSVHKVSAVTIYNRQDCCAETLIGAEIRVGNKRYFHDHSNPRCDVISAVVVKKQSVTFQCPDMEGRYVSVVNPGTSKLIEMCEVEIYASPVADITPSVPPPPAGPVLPLPSVSLLLGGRNVTLVFAKLCWSDALIYCRRHHWDLLSLHSEEEQNEVEDLLSRSPVLLTDYVWVGLRRLLMKDSWFWMSGGSMTFTKWLKHPPTKLYSHSCGAMASRELYSWENRPCEQPLHFICQTADENGSQLQRIYFYSSSTKP